MTELERYLARIRDLAGDIPPGVWAARRSSDGALLLEADGEPLALVYAGRPLARYLEAVSPVALLGAIMPAAALLAAEAETGPDGRDPDTEAAP